MYNSTHTERRQETDVIGQPQDTLNRELGSSSYAIRSVAPTGFETQFTVRPTPKHSNHSDCAVPTLMQYSVRRRYYLLLTTITSIAAERTH